jgi:hypothetical protein
MGVSISACVFDRGSENKSLVAAVDVSALAGIGFASVTSGVHRSRAMKKYYSNLIVPERDQAEGIFCKGRGWQIAFEANPYWV